MPRRRPLLLLPPSKGKSEGGGGPPYAATLPGSELADARTRVLEALAHDVPGLDDAAVARLAGVGAAGAVEQRASLVSLGDAPTSPANRRYTGVVHGNAGLADLRPGQIRAEVRIVSGLLGLVALGDPVPAYRLEFTASLPSLGGLAGFWREAVSEHLAALGRGRRVWDLLPGEHRRVWSTQTRAGLDVVEVAFLRPDGRSANAARTKVAKGRLAAALLAEPGMSPSDLPGHVDLGPGWSVHADGPSVTAIYAG
ncbi:MAG: peroxide stress protein YaaA [Nitriliruptor sp.]|uniref:peroxide stress protein YaaA n=1 Tax=Nitriliruptor sp. TaxID=2448056 RepID=UPI00349FD5AF